MELDILESDYLEEELSAVQIKQMANVMGGSRSSSSRRSRRGKQRPATGSPQVWIGECIDQHNLHDAPVVQKIAGVISRVDFQAAAYSHSRKAPTEKSAAASPASPSSPFTRWLLGGGATRSTKELVIIAATYILRHPKPKRHRLGSRRYTSGSFGRSGFAGL